MDWASVLTVGCQPDHNILSLSMLIEPSSTVKAYITEPKDKHLTPSHWGAVTSWLNLKLSNLLAGLWHPAQQVQKEACTCTYMYTATFVCVNSILYISSWPAWLQETMFISSPPLFAQVRGHICHIYLHIKCLCCDLGAAYTWQFFIF